VPEKFDEMDMYLSDSIWTSLALIAKFLVDHRNRIPLAPGTQKKSQLVVDCINMAFGALVL
jgi:hypothetical protein